MTEIRVLLVDDHALVRESLSDLLEQEPALSVVDTAGTANEAVDKARIHQPDVVVMDIDMPGRTCFEAVRTIHAMMPSIRVIFLSAYTHDHYIEQALRVGALGYITKHEPVNLVVQAIQDVASGKAWFSEQVRSRIVFDQDHTRLAPSGRSRASSLTPREIEVLRYVARGLAKKEIARVMSVSLKTVEKHSDHLMRKLDIHDRVELTRFAIRERLVDA